MRIRYELAVMLAASAMVGMSFSARADDASRRTSDVQRTQAAPFQKDAALPTKEKKAMTTDELKQRGKELRAEIEQAYQKFRGSMEFRKAKMADEDISPATGKYIPPGTPFEDAEIILRNAGFELSPSPPRPPVSNPPPGYRDEYRFDISGTMILDQGLTYEFSAWTSVTPESPGAPHAKAKGFTVWLYHRPS